MTTARKPFTITSPRHAMAGASYAICALTGLIHLLGVTHSGSLVSILTPVGAQLWAFLLAIGGIGGFLSSRVAAATGVPRAPLRAERASTFTLALCLLSYEAGLVLNMGFDAITTQIIVTGLGVGAAVRAWQITFELDGIDAALADPALTDPVLADPLPPEESPQDPTTG